MSSFYFRKGFQSQCVPSLLCISMLSAALANFSDNIICDFLEYSLYLNYTASTPPLPTFKNCSSANTHKASVREAVCKEVYSNAKAGPFSSNSRYSVSDGIPKTPILMNPTKFTLLAQRLWFLSTQSLAKDVSFKKRILAMPFTNFLSTHLITITLDTWCITLSSSKFSSLAIVQQPCLPARNQCYHLSSSSSRLLFN